MSALTGKPEGGEGALVEAAQIVQLDTLAVDASREDEAFGIECGNGTSLK